MNQPRQKMNSKQLATVHLGSTGTYTQGFTMSCRLPLHSYKAENEQKTMKGIDLLFQLTHVPVEQIRLLLYDIDVL